jgi:hypothetical protein
VKVEIEISEDLMKKFKALAILRPLEGGIDAIVNEGLEKWVTQEIIGTLVPDSRYPFVYTGPRPAPQETAPAFSPSRRRSRSASVPVPSESEFDAFDASGISEGLADQDDDIEEDARTSDPEAFITSQGGLTEEALDRDMRINDPDHEAKVDASSIKEKKLTGSASYQTPEQLFAEHSGLPTPPPVAEDDRARRRRKTQTGKGRASHFTGHEEFTL